ncbi:hypothetical protein N9609_00985 [bacterium]|nr:hypothetical protein [bacterium]
MLGLMGVYLLFFHKYLSPYLSPKKIMTCKSSRYTGHCGVKGSEVELFWGGFKRIEQSELRVLQRFILE